MDERVKSCMGCKKPITGTVYEYIDPTSETISRNSGVWCHDCYGSRFGHRPAWPEAVWPHEELNSPTLSFGHPLTSGDFWNRDSGRSKTNIIRTLEGTCLQ